MFYKKQDVDSALICSFCSEVLRDPRSLTCGASACHECIKKQIKTNNELECLFCKEKHLAPNQERGFPPNLIALKLLDSKAENVFRNQVVDSLDSKLANMESELAEMQVKREKMSANIEVEYDKIHDQCSKL